MYGPSHVPPHGTPQRSPSSSGDAGPRRLGANGRYVLGDELGRGGMGVVYRAHDAQLDRPVAIKVLTQSTATGEAERQRFVREANAVMRLRHASIVPIHDVGEEQGRPFLVMPLIDGSDLERALRKNEVRPRRLAEIVREVALALDFAHREGFVHRDVKPENIMLPAHGKPILMDFGLARDLQSDERLTVTGEVVGTPNYMAPEQVDGEGGAEARSDVYALGAVLFRGLCGRPPFIAEMPYQVITMVLMEDPPAPSSIVADVDPSLEAIALRCLHKEPDGRYESARALADELDRWLRGEDTEVRPLSGGERLRRRARGAARHAGSRLRSAVPIAIGAVLLAGGGATYAVLRRSGAAAGPGGGAAAPADPTERVLADFDAAFAAAVGGDPEGLQKAADLLREVERLDEPGAGALERVKMVRRLQGLARGDETLVRTLPLDRPPWTEHTAGIARLLAEADQPRALGKLLERFPALVRDDDLRDALAAIITTGRLVPNEAIAAALVEGLRREELARRSDPAARARLRTLRAGTLARRLDAILVGDSPPLAEVERLAAELVRLLQLGTETPKLTDIAHRRILELAKKAFELPHLPKDKDAEDKRRARAETRRNALLFELAVWDARLAGDAPTEGGLYDNAHIIIFTNFSSTDRAVRYRSQEVGTALIRLGYWTPRELIDTDVSRGMLLDLLKEEVALGAESLDPARAWSILSTLHAHVVKEMVSERQRGPIAASTIALGAPIAEDLPDGLWTFAAAILERERVRGDVPGFVLAWLAHTTASAFAWSGGRPSQPDLPGIPPLAPKIERAGGPLLAAEAARPGLRGVIDRLHELASLREAGVQPAFRRLDGPTLRAAWLAGQDDSLAEPATLEATLGALERLGAVKPDLMSGQRVAYCRELALGAARRLGAHLRARGDGAEALGRLADAVARAAPDDPLAGELRAGDGGGR